MEERGQFSKCLSDPKLIVARHVFSDNDDFYKKTLDVGEQIQMIHNRRRLTDLYRVFSSWRVVVREGLLLGHHQQRTQQSLNSEQGAWGAHGAILHEVH